MGREYLISWWGEAHTMACLCYWARPIGKLAQQLRDTLSYSTLAIALCLEHQEIG
jgi:hypothetical protein